MVADNGEVLETFPTAAIDYDNIHFYRGLLDRQFLVNRCAECGFWHTPPRSVCPKCWSRKVVPTSISGRGVLHMVVWLHEGKPPQADPDVPCPLGTIELAEQSGLRISAMVSGCAKEEIRLDMTVQLEWKDYGGVPFPTFRPLEQADLGS